MPPPVAPWYKHRWPWFIIALVGSAMAASLFSAYLAVRYPDPVIDRAAPPVEGSHPPVGAASSRDPLLPPDAQADG